MSEVLNGAYPRNLGYVARRLRGWSQQTVRLNTVGPTTASPNGVIRFDLPANSLINLDTLNMFFKVQVQDDGAPIYAGLPKNSESFIRRMEVEVNGRQLCASCDYLNLLTNAIYDMTLGTDKNNERAIMHASPHTTVGSFTMNATGPTQLAISNFPILNSLKPSFLNTALAKNVRITLYLAPEAILTAGDTYELSDIFFTVNTCSLDDNHFMNMHYAYLQQGGVYELTYKNYASFTQSPNSLTQSTPFSVSSQSVNKVLAFMRTNVPIVPTAALTKTKTSPYFSRVGKKISSWNVNINGVSHPNFNPTGEQAFPLILNVFNKTQDALGGSSPWITSLADFTDFFWLCGISLDQGNEFEISGLPTVGNNAACYFTTSSTDTTTYTNVQSHVFVEMTSSLLIKAGGVVDVFF